MADSIPGVESLAAWRARAREAPERLPADELRASAWQCAASFLDGPAAFDEAADWYDGYRNDGHVTRSELPVALPFLVDLGALIAGPHPAADLAAPPAGADPHGLWPLLRSEYARGCLGLLARCQAVRFVPPAAGGRARNRRTRRRVVARFIDLLFDWAAAAWRRADEAAGAAGDRWAGGVPLLAPTESAGLPDRAGPRGPRLRRLYGADSAAGAAAARRRSPRGVRLRPRRPAGPPSARPALRSPLDEQAHAIDPLLYEPRAPVAPADAPGDHVAVRRVRRTDRPENLADVLPQELALLRVEPHGKRLLLEKLYREGLLAWERQSFAQAVRRKTFLICYLADAGAAVRHGGARDAKTAGAHAQQLIFDSLRDFTARMGGRPVRLDFRVYLHDAHRPERRLAWAFSLEQLRERFGDNSFDDMIELEDLAPGYFFRRPRPAGVPPPPDPGTYLRLAFRRGGLRPDAVRPAGAAGGDGRAAPPAAARARWAAGRQAFGAAGAARPPPRRGRAGLPGRLLGAGGRVPAMRRSTRARLPRRPAGRRPRPAARARAGGVSSSLVRAVP